MTTELTWTGSPDDQTARSGEYVLRAEDMGGFRWWSAYFKDEQIGYGDKPDMVWAKQSAEDAMKEHLKTCKD